MSPCCGSQSLRCSLPTQQPGLSFQNRSVSFRSVCSKNFTHGAHQSQRRTFPTPGSSPGQRLLSQFQCQLLREAVLDPQPTLLVLLLTPLQPLPCGCSEQSFTSQSNLQTFYKLLSPPFLSLGDEHDTAPYPQCTHIIKGYTAIQQVSRNTGKYAVGQAGAMGGQETGGQSSLEK